MASGRNTYTVLCTRRILSLHCRMVMEVHNRALLLSNVQSWWDIFIAKLLVEPKVVLKINDFVDLFVRLLKNETIKYGDYTAIKKALNTMGLNDIAEIIEKYEQKMKLPYDLKIKCITSHSVLLKFKCDCWSHKWNVEGERNGGQWKSLFEVEFVNGEPIIIENLCPNSNYRLRLRSKSNAVTAPSEQFTTLEERPDQPTDLTASLVSSRCIMIKWKKPSKWKGIPKGYWLCFKTADSVCTFNKIAIYAERDSYILEDLQEEKEYVIKMKAITDIGSSDFCPEARIHTGQAYQTKSRNDQEDRFLSSQRPASKRGHKDTTCMSLYQAVKLNDFVEIKRLLDNGKDPLLGIGKVQSPFELALESQNENIIKMLANSICHSFKTHIDSKHEYMLHSVWMSYAYNEDNPEIKLSDISIVALVNIFLYKTLPEEFKNIPIYWRQKNEVSEESKHTSQFEIMETNDQSLKAEDTEWLFYIHSNLNIIHPSSYKSIGFSTPKHRIEEQACVALFCQTKLYIPLCEKAFPKVVAGMVTDVREGYCKLAGGELLGTTVFSFKSKLCGTIGGLVDKPLKGFITAAHVVADANILDFDTKQQQQFLKKNKLFVYKSQSDDPIGEVVCWCFEHGDQERPGVDAALVKLCRVDTCIENTLPPSDQTSWQNAGYELNNLPAPCLDALMRDEIIIHKNSKILKYGMTTKLTIGRLAVTESDVKYIDENVSYKKEPCIMYKQMIVKGINGTKFCGNGDSGAFCFMIDKNDRRKLQPFAMIIACREDTGDAIVTPLIDVFQRLRDNTDKVLGLQNDVNSPEQVLKFAIESHMQELQKHFTKQFDVQQKNLSQQINEQYKSISMHMKSQNKRIKKIENQIKEFEEKEGDRSK